MPDARPHLPAPPNLTPICAIGASAGGVAALQALFRQLPTDLGLAYIVILHLAPDHTSRLDEVLGACTRMGVHQVTDSPTLKPDCIYVIAPGSQLVIEGDSVSAQPFSEPRGKRLPIDVLFESIAAARGDGVGMVLSGSGSDGAAGVRAVKAAGGVVMVQDPSEAEFPSMPQSALETGAVDIVAPMARLAERLAEVARSKEAVRSLDVDGAANDLRHIVHLLRAHTGHDFSSYKRATVLRRVMRRMQVAGVDSLSDYATRLRDRPGEAKALFADLLISVTAFFRDARAFEALGAQAVERILDDHVARGGEEGVRAWVVGCATGEEAYSLAMLFQEALPRRELHIPVLIFATDLDEAALATAREGCYPRSIDADVSQERLARFFTDEGAHYRVRNELRQCVLFAHHSVLKDAPFIRLDLVSCRNLLIYLERSLQQQVCSIFHYALKDEGVLFLGSAETVDMSGELFVALDRDARIYAARSTVAQLLPVLPQFPATAAPASIPAVRPVTGERVQAAALLHATGLERAAPPSALVDGAGAILNLSPTAGRFILHSGGPVSNLLSAVVRPELRLELSLALTRVLEHGETILSHPATVAFEGERRRVTLHAAPVPGRSREGAQALVLFLDGGPEPADLAESAPGETRPEEVRRLQTALSAAQEALVASRAGHDQSVEELRGANEELQSTNEEYRSTAEELETSREELQSINEELHTVNAELKGRLESLSVAHSDLQNLTAATEIGTLFLDGELRIRMFTPPVVKVFNITAADVGRPITNFTYRLDHPRLVEDARAVLRDATPVEWEAQSQTGACFLVRMRPYRTMEARVEGVVLTFVDVTERLKTESALGRSAQEFRALVRGSSQALFRMSPDWSELREMIAAAFLAPSGGPARSWIEHYVPPQDRPRVREVVQAAIAAKGVFDLEHRVVRADGSIGWIRTRAIPILDDAGAIAEWFGSADDVTEQHRAQSALRESEERLRVLVEGVPQLVWRADGEGRWTWSSPQWRGYTGLSDAESRGRGWQAAVHPDDRDAAVAASRDAVSHGALEIECRLRHVRGTDYRWFRGRATPLLDGRGEVIEWLGTFTDIHDLRTLQGRQEVLLAELQHRVRNILAVIRSVAARTADGSETVGDYAAHLEGRLGSLARTQVLLTRHPGVGVDLELMVREELLAQAAQEGRLSVEGPPVSLSPQAAEILTLAVHELATNAVKYGALSAPQGSVRVSWAAASRGGERWLNLRWVESGVRVAAAAPRREGFGSELIEQRVPYELEGSGRLEFLPGGVSAEISFPLRDGDSVLQTDARAADLLGEGA